MGIITSRDNGRVLTSVATISGGSYSCIEYDDEGKTKYRLDNTTGMGTVREDCVDRDDMYDKLRKGVDKHQYVSTY